MLINDLLNKLCLTFSNSQCSNLHNDNWNSRGFFLLTSMLNDITNVTLEQKKNFIQIIQKIKHSKTTSSMNEML